MPTFATPEPITVTFSLAAGHLRIRASDRTDTVVDVRPTNPGDDTDVHAAEQTRVEFTNGRLLVKTPRDTLLSLFRADASVDVTVDLPAGSRVTGGAASSDLDAQGRLGEVEFSTASGDIRLEEAGRLRLNTASGDIVVDRSVGHTTAVTASGEIRIQEIDGTSVVKNSSGDIVLGEVTGDLRLNAASGDISVDRSLASLVARAASGAVRIGELVRGSVVVKVSSGDVELGIREGSAAWLDVKSTSGSVRSSLEASDGPGQSDEEVTVHARTISGDIVISRA